MTRCLLVIDIQNDYFPGGLLPLWQAEEVETRIVAAIGQARAAGDRVVVVRHMSPEPGLLSASSPGSALRAAILAAAGDAPVVEKIFADAFQDTGLTAALAGVQELLVCGMMTQNCVVFTAMSRATDGMAVRVLADLCTAPSEIVHLIAVDALGSKLALVTAEAVWR